MRFIEDITEKESALWQALLRSSEYVSFFQTPECFSLYSKCSFLEPFVYAVEAEGRLQALMCGFLTSEPGTLRGWFSRRAIVPGGLLLCEGCDVKAIEMLLNGAVERLSRRAIYIEIRNYADYSAYSESIERSGFRYVEHLDVRHDTSVDPMTLMSSSKRRQVRAVLAEGVSCRIASAADVPAWYGILADMYMNRIHLPLFPMEFFLRAIESEHIRLIVTEKDGRITGGMLVPFIENRIAYEWFVCGDAVNTYAGLDFAFSSGIPTFDFMGAGTADVPYGVRDFKISMGGRLCEFGRFLYRCDKFLYWLGSQAIKLRL